VAKVSIQSGDVTISIDTNDDEAAEVVQSFAQSFAEAGGAWLGGRYTDADVNSDVEAGSLVQWLPAASTIVQASFDGETPPEVLDGIPGNIPVRR
jgi:hypothetical protein